MPAPFFIYNITEKTMATGTKKEPSSAAKAAYEAHKKQLDKTKNEKKVPKGGAIYRRPGLTFNPKTFRFNCPRYETIPSADKILVNGEYEDIFYVVSERKEKYSDGTISKVPILGEIALIDGIIKVEEHQQTLYDYLEKCNYNSSNPNRREDKPIFFERVDEEKGKIASLKIVQAENKAINFLYEMWEADKDRMLSYAAALSINLKQSEEAILADLISKAKADPEGFIKNSDSVVYEIKSTINMAEMHEIIKYSAGINTWFWADKSEIVRLAAGVNPHDGFIEWLTDSQNKQTYELIARKLAEKA